MHSSPPDGGSERRESLAGFGPALLCLLSIFAVPLTSPAADILFSKEVRPILEQKCLECHGTDTPMSNLDLRTRQGMLKGGVRGAAVIPGDSSESRVYLQISGTEGPVMPMGGALSDDEILTLKDWINQGAKWDVDRIGEGAQSAKAADTKTREKAGKISAEDRNWWAFQQPLRHAKPKVADKRWNRSPVDAFIKAKLDEEGLVPAPRAGKRTLIRRAYLDLLGLLPPPSEVEAFVNDKSRNAFKNLVDRLLESPRYGERWGRHWLDVARYADSGGYEHDYDYPYAWRYRDYVIQALNDDKPYDQFIREQLAGDELDEVTFETLIATGFNRVAATVGFREKDNPQYRYTYLDDMIGTTSRAFMGLTVNCARCHDHKFDPILQTDYYQMMATFFSFVNYDYPLASPEEVAAYEARKSEVQGKIDPLKARISEIETPYKDTAFEKRLKDFPEEIQIAVHTPEAERTPGQKLLAEQVITLRARPADVEELLPAADKEEVAKLKTGIAELEKQMPEELPRAMGISDGDYRFAPDGRGDEKLPGKGDRQDFGVTEGSFLPVAGKPYVPPPAFLLPGGDYRTKGEEVQPGFVTVLARGDEPTEIPPSSGRISSGRRRALAEWIASQDHPLTARVMANRIWHFHFGRGIVTTPSNFGRTGQPPVYPKLLDWLATEFVRRGWSIKAMHRLIMNTESYQMASSFPHEANQQADPAGKFLWRFPQRRLEAETIRDVVLNASGNLNFEMGGKPFFPPIPKSVRLSFKNGAWTLTEEGPDVWRRSIYSYWKRGLKYPMFEVFDQPDSNVTCERRASTTVPTQALTMLNNGFFLLQAKHFAGRVAGKAGEDEKARVSAAYEIALSRPPSAKELDMNLSFLASQRRYHEGQNSAAPELAALVDLCDVVLNLSEFIYIN